AARPAASGKSQEERPGVYSWADSHRRCPGDTPEAYTTIPRGGGQRFLPASTSTSSSGRLARGLRSGPTAATALASIPDRANVHLFACVSITSGGRFSVIAGGCEDAMHVFGLLACNPRRGAVRCRFFRGHEQVCD